MIKQDMSKGIKKSKRKTSPPPLQNDPLRRFYESLFRQNPKSAMAIKWLCENGLGHIVIDLKPLKVNK